MAGLSEPEQSSIVASEGPPEIVTRYYCPACGKDMTGVSSYDVDERPQAKCRGRVHTRMAAGYVYALASGPSR